MILRRGVGALVPAGLPYFARQAPLVPTIINTIAGREFEGGRYGVTRNVLGTNPVLRGSRMKRRGMGDVQYCSNNPPICKPSVLSRAANEHRLLNCGLRRYGNSARDKPWEISLYRRLRIQTRLRWSLRSIRRQPVLRIV